MRAYLQLAYGFAIIAALMAVQAAVLYAIYWLVLVVVRRVPLMGRKHRHADWVRLNRDSIKQ